MINKHSYLIYQKDLEVPEILRKKLICQIIKVCDLSFIYVL